jgi:hypothetical protein
MSAWVCELNILFRLKIEESLNPKPYLILYR